MEYDRPRGDRNQKSWRVADERRPVKTDLAGEAWSLLQRVVFSQRPRWMAAIREYDLVPPHWIALQTLDEPKPMGELAKQLACTAPTSPGSRTGSRSAGWSSARPPNTIDG